MVEVLSETLEIVDGDGAEILLFIVRENMLPMSLSCWRRGRGEGVRGRNTMA